MNRDFAELRIDFGEFSLAKVHLQRPHVIFEIFQPLRSRNRQKISTLGEHPCQCKLGRRTAFVRGDLLNRFGKLEIRIQRLLLKSRMRPAEIARVEIVQLLNRARKKSAAQGTISNKSDSQFFAGGEDAV